MLGPVGEGVDDPVGSAAPVAVRVGALGGLYLVQGIVWGFGGLLLLPRLAAAGVPLEHQTGIFALAGAPWVFKLAWGPVLDQRWARRLGAGRLAALASVMVAAALAAMAILDPPSEHVAAIALAWLLLNVALSLQDVSTDALAFDVIAAAARGRAVSVMLAGHHLGAEALAGAWVGGIVARHGLPAGLVVLAGVTVVVAVAVGTIVPGGQGRAAPRVGLVDAGAALLSAPRGGLVVALAACVFAADVLTAAVSGAWFVSLGWSPEDAAARVVLVVLVGNLGGYVTAAAVMDRIGHAKMLAVSSAALGATWLVFAATGPLWHDVVYVQAFVAVQTFVTAWLYAATHTLLMDATQPKIRATQFAIFTACLNLPRLWAPLVGAWAVGAVGFAATFAGCGLWQVAVAAAGAGILRRSPTRAYS